MALFMSGVSISTLPKCMWDSIVLEISPTVAAVSTMMIAVSVLLFATAQIAARTARRRAARAGATDAP